MKNIIFIAQLKGIGGVEKSLINLLKTIPQSEVAVTVAFFEGNKHIRDEIPQNIKQIRIERVDNKSYLVCLLKSGDFLQACKLGINCLIDRISRTVSYKTMLSKTERYENIDGKYDCAISWAMPDAFENIFTLEKVKADKKIMLIHMDLNHYRMPKDSTHYLKGFDYFYCVSKACKKAFMNRLPELSDKTTVFYNVINKETILSLYKSEISNIKRKNRFTIVSCGRLAKEKRPLQAVEICKELVKRGYSNICWYWIGDGSLHQQVLEKIKDNNVEDNFVLLGAKKNPFPYMGDADLYVQLSHHESFCLTLAEALILGVPVISTNFEAAYEIIDDGKNGLIVAKETNLILETIIKLITDINLRTEMRNEARNIEISKFSSSGAEFIKMISNEGGNETNDA